MRKIIPICICIMLFLLSGCAAIIEGDARIVRPHTLVPNERPAVARREASNFDELKAVILDLVMQHETSGRIIYSWDEDVQADIDRAVYDIMSNHPIGAYATSAITGVATRIVSYFEIDVSIEYQRTRRQVDAIISVSTPLQLRTELLDAMSSYRDEAVFRTALRTVTAESVAEMVRELYYQNPRDIVMLPSVAVTLFPEHGNDRVIEVRFGNTFDAEILRDFGESLADNVRLNAVAADTDALTLLSLAESLIATCAYDEDMARTISEHGAQNFAATAYGALVNRSAVGEGFAMAFKALSDELELYNRVVLGHLDGMFHAWNIVLIDGQYYHIDVAMGAVNGIETTFMKTDADFIAMGYTWDMEAVPRASGALTFFDINRTETQQ